MGFVEVWFANLILSFGGSLPFMVFGICFIAGVLYLGRHSLPSSILLGVVFTDGIVRIANDPLLNTLFLVLKIFVFALIGLSIIFYIRRFSG